MVFKLTPVIIILKGGYKQTKYFVLTSTQNAGKLIRLPTLGLLYHPEPTNNNNMSVNYSFYIPRMATTHGEDSVRAAFRFLGNVKRADFIPIEGDDRFQKAFVHLDHIIESETNTEIINRVFERGENTRIYPETFNPRVYWILVRTKNPVTETRLNIHQVVENANILQSVVEAQAQEIKALREQYSGDIHRLHQTIQEMLLFVCPAPDAIHYRLVNNMKYGQQCDTDYIMQTPDGEFITRTQDFVNKGLGWTVCAPEDMKPM